MTDQDFAGNVALEVNSRLAKILPVLDDFCVEEGYGLNQLQRIALGSVILELFGDLCVTVEGMVGTFDVLRRFAESPFSEPLTDASINAWLADDIDGRMQ